LLSALTRREVNFFSFAGFQLSRNPILDRYIKGVELKTKGFNYVSPLIPALSPFVVTAKVKLMVMVMVNGDGKWK